MILSAKIRLMTNNNTTPAATKIWAAMAIGMCVGRVAHTMRMTHVVIRAMQKPNIMPDMMNLWPRLLFIWKMVIWATAPQMKRNKKTAEMGTSVETVGTPPRLAVVGGYGACWRLCCCDPAASAYFQVSRHREQEHSRVRYGLTCLGSKKSIK